jgi:hypothetical protein
MYEPGPYGHPSSIPLDLHSTDTLSPPRKRQRMSSPTYDQQVDLSQDDLEAFDKIEHTISQLHSQSSSQIKGKSSPLKVKKVSQTAASSSAKEKRHKEIAEALQEVHRAGTGKEKENMHAVGGCGGRMAVSASPSNDVIWSSQPHENLELDNDSENPFNISNTSQSQSSSLLPSRTNTSLEVTQIRQVIPNYLVYTRPSNAQVSLCWARVWASQAPQPSRSTL